MYLVSYKNIIHQLCLIATIICLAVRVSSSASVSVPVSITVEDIQRVQSQAVLSSQCPHEFQPKHLYSLVVEANKELNLTQPPTQTNILKSDMFYKMYHANYRSWLFAEHNGSYSYAVIFKCASEEIVASLLTDRDPSSDWDSTKINPSRQKLLATAKYQFNVTKMPVIFTIVRDPLSHFVSGLVESYTRKYIKYGSIPDQRTVNSSQATYEKVKEIITAIVQFDAKTVHANVKDILHYSIQAYQMTLFKPDLVGHLENIMADWGAIMSNLGIPNKQLVTVSDTHIVTVEDVLGFKKQLRTLFEQEPKYLRAVCRLILVDYACIQGYHLPAACADML